MKTKIAITTTFVITSAILAFSTLSCSPHAHGLKPDMSTVPNSKNVTVKGNTMDCNTLTVSGLQMVTTNDVAQNEKKILAAIKKAAEEGADFLLTPEGSLSGYTPDFDRQQVADAVERVAAEAKKAKVGLLLGTCYKQLEDNEEFCYNQVRVYTPEGKYLGYHAKILRCSSLDHPGTGEMAEYVEGTLRTFDYNAIRFGVLICNDLWATPGYTTKPNPYLAWKLKQAGAQLIFHAINSGSNQRQRTYHESNVEQWALALKIPILGVNAVQGPDKQVSAPSGLVSPDGKRPFTAHDIGEQFFTCKIEF